MYFHIVWLCFRSDTYPDIFYFGNGGIEKIVSIDCLAVDCQQYIGFAMYIGIDYFIFATQILQYAV